MPIYEYNCSDCGEQFEHLHRQEAEEVRCPACNGTQIEKQFSTFSARAAASRPACEGAVPACSESMCRSGQCPMSR